MASTTEATPLARLARSQGGGDDGRDGALIPLLLMDLSSRLEGHLRAWLGHWPPQHRLDVVGSPRRLQPGWNGVVYPVVGVATPEGTVLSLPPGVVDDVRSLGDDIDAVGRALPALVGRPEARFGSGVFRWCHTLVDIEPVGVWVPVDDGRVPPWLKPFNGEVLVHFDGDGRYGAGLGRKRHDRLGQELAVGTEPACRGRGLARALVAQAARRVADDGGIATYLHDPANLASARAADAAGFPDVGWRILGLPTAS